MTASVPVAEADTELAQDPRHFGGGGVGWLKPTDAKRVVIVALPGGLGGGVAVPAAVAGQLSGEADSLRRSSESAESPRAVGVAAAILALLLAASSTVWALYKFKPGLVKDQPEVYVPPIYVVDQFFDAYRPPSPTSPSLVSNGTTSPMIGVFHAVATTTTPAGGVNTASQTALGATNWNNYINELASLFSTQLTATGSGIAGLMAGAATVTRGTQTELIGAGLGRQAPGNYIHVLEFNFNEKLCEVVNFFNDRGNAEGKVWVLALALLS